MEIKNNSFVPERTNAHDLLRQQWTKKYNKCNEIFDQLRKDDVNLGIPMPENALSKWRDLQRLELECRKISENTPEWTKAEENLNLLSEAFREMNKRRNEKIKKARENSAYRMESYPAKEYMKKYHSQEMKMKYDLKYLKLLNAFNKEISFLLGNTDEDSFAAKGELFLSAGELLWESLQMTPGDMDKPSDISQGVPYQMWCLKTLNWQFKDFIAQNQEYVRSLRIMKKAVEKYLESPLILETTKLTYEKDLKGCKLFIKFYEPIEAELEKGPQYVFSQDDMKAVVMDSRYNLSQQTILQSLGKEYSGEKPWEDFIKDPEILEALETPWKELVTVESWQEILKKPWEALQYTQPPNMLFVLADLRKEENLRGPNEFVTGLKALSREYRDFENKFDKYKEQFSTLHNSKDSTNSSNLSFAKLSELLPWDQIPAFLECAQVLAETFARCCNYIKELKAPFDRAKNANITHASLSKFQKFYERKPNQHNSLIDVETDGLIEINTSSDSISHLLREMRNKYSTSVSSYQDILNSFSRDIDNFVCQLRSLKQKCILLEELIQTVEEPTQE